VTVAQGEDADGDTARFTSIYQRNYTRVLGYALAHSGREVAEDIANETFLTAWRKLDEVPEGDPLPWLLGVARNHRLKQLATGRRPTPATRWIPFRSLRRRCVPRPSPSPSGAAT
jgi:RNA polymerase sigma-70 factor, ECF subfamily